MIAEGSTVYVARREYRVRGFRTASDVLWVELEETRGSWPYATAVVSFDELAGYVAEDEAAAHREAYLDAEMERRGLYRGMGGDEIPDDVYANYEPLQASERMLVLSVPAGRLDAVLAALRDPETTP